MIKGLLVFSVLLGSLFPNLGNVTKVNEEEVEEPIDPIDPVEPLFILNEKYYLKDSNQKSDGAYIEVSIHTGNNLFTADYMSFTVNIGFDDADYGTYINPNDQVEVTVHAYFVFENNQRGLGEYDDIKWINFGNSLHSENLNADDTNLYANDYPKYSYYTYSFCQYSENGYFDSHWVYSIRLNVHAEYTYSAAYQYTVDKLFSGTV
jgi:hypothetical protein